MNDKYQELLALVQSMLESAHPEEVADLITDRNTADIGVVLRKIGKPPEFATSIARLKSANSVPGYIPDVTVVGKFLGGYSKDLTFGLQYEILSEMLRSYTSHEEVLTLFGAFTDNRDLQAKFLAHFAFNDHESDRRTYLEGLEEAARDVMEADAAALIEAFRSELQRLEKQAKAEANEEEAA